MGDGKKRALLLHGFPGTPAELRAVAEFLVTLGFQVRVPLLPGFGMGISELGRTRWGRWVEAAESAWDDLKQGSDSAVLLGFSMGGAVALNAAAHARPDQLVLIAPFWRMSDARARLLPLLRYALPQLRPFEKADFASEVVRAQFRRLEPTLDLSDPEVQRAIREQVALPTAALVELQRLGVRAYRAAAKVSAPTLVLQGRTDTTVALADTRRLAARLRGPVTFSELGGGHQLIGPHEAGHGALLGALRQNLLA